MKKISSTDDKIDMFLGCCCIGIVFLVIFGFIFADHEYSNKENATIEEIEKNITPFPVLENSSTEINTSNTSSNITSSNSVNEST